MTTIARDVLKAEMAQRLGEVAVEHPVGHQGKLAARFILRSHGGEGIEFMFEKGPSTSPNLWVQQRYAELLMDGRIEHRVSLAHALHALTNAKGKKIYGRHSALRAMPQLADADLVCFKLRSMSELEQVIKALQGARQP